MADDLYSEGMRIAGGLLALDGPNVNPVCATRVYSHGHRTERALVLLHGFTNCPQQFDLIGRDFHERGWNVLIPRYPRHGYLDRLNTTVSELRSDHLIALANQSVRVAHGLGRHVTVAGMSLGGSLAGHLAQTNEHVDRALLIAPLFGLRRLPGFLQPSLGRVAHTLPNFYVWWDNALKEKLKPDYGYPRFSTHAYAALLEVATSVLRAAQAGPPRTSQLAFVTNANEPGVDNRYTYRLADAWRGHGAEVTTHEFPRSERLPHDLIDPMHPEQNTELVYPVIRRLIEG